MGARAQPKEKSAAKAECPPKSVSEEKVKAATGRDWMDWFVILNNMKATELPHKDVTT
jgi:hypothetical protein